MTYLDRAHYETMVYEELVNRLRTLAKYTWYSATVLEAADAIEELSALVDRYGGETGIKNLQEYAGKYWDVIKQIRQKETSAVSTDEEEGVCKAIDEMPTIIPASKEVAE